MSKVSKSQSAGCAFCGEPWGNGVNKTREHVLAKWLRDLIGPLPQQRASSGKGLQLNDKADAYVELPLVSKKDQSSIMNMVTREVCQACNNGWMSRLETDARPIIEGLHACAASESTLKLTPADACILARWVHKTALASELGGGGHFGGPADRRTVMDGSPLPRSLVWLGRHTSYMGVSTAQALIGISDNRIPSPDDEVSNASLFILSLQRLAIAVYLRPGRRPEVPPMPPQEWVRIWPTPATIEFPPITGVDPDTLARLLGHKRTWLPPLSFASYKNRAI